MRYKAPPLAKSDASIRLADLGPLADGWLDDCEIREHSARTVETRRDVIRKLEWFLRTKGHESCGTREIRAFLAYLIRGHNEEGGRWGNPACTKPVKPVTTLSYYNILRTFCAFLVDQGELPTSPMATMKPPICRDDQIVPFTPEQVEALVAQAKKSSHPKRNEALVWFLLDTGARASEVCSLRAGDLDLSSKRSTVLGKGKKARTLPFGRKARTALWNYLRHEKPREDDQLVFLSDRGHTPGEGLTRSGLGQIIRKLGAAAGVEAVRCSPHTFRHTFAIEFLRDGGDVFTLQMLLGHESLEIVKRYLAIAKADVVAQHKLHSPADRMGKRRK